jgi:predicted 3-demethylubiquinone-9 3-methyltransferase (glyoxalase superfamily)
MSFYVSLYSDAEIISDERYGAGRVGAEGSVRVASFRIGGLTVRCIDSPVRLDFTLTPAISRFIDCESADDLE